MIVFIDTNVLLAALRSRQGASYRLVSRLDRPAIQIVVSVPLVIEYEKAALEHIDMLPFTPEEINRLIDYLCRIAVRQKIYFLWRPFMRDPQDDMLLELAVAGGCRYIVTFNKRHMAGIDAFGLMAVTPAEFLHITGEGET